MCCVRSIAKLFLHCSIVLFLVVPKLLYLTAILIKEWKTVSLVWTPRCRAAGVGRSAPVCCWQRLFSTDPVPLTGSVTRTEQPGGWERLSIHTDSRSLWCLQSTSCYSMIKLVESCTRFLQRCFQIAAARLWLPKATCDQNGSAARMCLCSCVCDPNLVSLFLYWGSAATLEQPAPQKISASSHSATFDISRACAAVALKDRL